MQENDPTTTGAALPLPEDNDEERTAGLAKVEARAAAEELAADGMEAAAASGQRIAPESELRVFLAPQHRHAKFLVKVGTLIQFKAADSPSGMRDVGREGDVFAQFTGSVIATADPRVIEWCEAHGPDEDLHREYHRARDESTRACRAGVGVCCDARDPNAAAWCEMKFGQVPISDREAVMSPGMNVDRVLLGKGGGGRIGGEGERLVRAAEATKTAHEAARAKD